MKLAPKIMNEVFDFIECQYPLKNELRFKSRNIRTVRYGIETTSFVGSRVQTNMPNELKTSTSLNEFKSKIKTWKPESCPCKLCKIYLQRIGYLQVTDQHMFTDVIMFLYFILFYLLYIYILICKWKFVTGLL